LVNNVETLANVPWILRRGGEAYRALGFSRSRGTKVFALNSLFNRPGLYEVEFGVPVRHLVEDLGGGLREGTIRGLVIGGPLAGILPPKMFDTPLGFEELQQVGASVGHGGVVAFNEHTSLPQLMQHVFEFAADESCGECTPCRIGSRVVEQILRRGLENGSAWQRDQAFMTDVVSALRATSLCGLGTGLGEFAASALKYFPQEVARAFHSD
jgi:formate dehydrogenase iron-sulfur subunit